MARRWDRLTTRSSVTKIPFHVELPNLLVELGSEDLLVLLLASSTIFKEVRRPLSQGLLPGMDLARVDFKPAGQLWCAPPGARPKPLWP